jgi:hypothetical protein
VHMPYGCSVEYSVAALATLICSNEIRCPHFANLDAGVTFDLLRAAHELGSDCLYSIQGRRERAAIPTHQQSADGLHPLTIRNITNR